MPRPRKWASDAERKKTARQRARDEGRKLASGPSGKSRPKPPREFIAIDGEDFVCPQGAEYCMLSASTGDRLETPGRNILPVELFEWLIGIAARNPRTILVGYACEYDWQRVLRYLPASVTEQLLNPDPEQLERDRGFVWFRLPDSSARWGLRYIPSKLLEVVKSEFVGDRYQQEGRALWCNVHPFFQSPFVSAVGGGKGWSVSALEELATLKEWKDKRGGFTLADWDAVSAYNDLENELCVKLMVAFREALISAGLPLPRNWHGPGAVAKGLLRQHDTKEYLDPEQPRDVRDACLRAFFGGRIQCYQIGHFPETWDYDLNSAYPAANMLLPSEKGRWDRIHEWQGEYPWVVYRVHWNVGDMPVMFDGKRQKKRWNYFYPLAPFPWRDETDGRIYYPYEGQGFYWAWEVEPALKAWGPNRIQIRYGYRLTPETLRVFEWMEGLVAKRVAIKATQPAEAKVLKLAYNSVYGSIAQTVGAAQFHSPMMAGLITSACRGQILGAALTDPSAIIGFATDGVFSSRPLPLSLEDRPGGWELCEKAKAPYPLEIYQPGVYRFPDAEKPTCASRGIPGRLIDWDELAAKWKSGECGVLGSYSFSAPVGLRQAAAWGKLELAGTWVPKVRAISVDKHGWGYWLPSDRRGDTVRVSPHPHNPEVMSGRYLRSRFAQEAALTDEDDNLNPDLLEDIGG